MDAIFLFSGKSEAASTFGGRSLKLAPTKLNFQDQTNSELRRDDNEDNVSVLIEKTSLDSDRKGKLNKKKRRRRSQMKHARKGSKSSLRQRFKQKFRDWKLFQNHS